MASEFKGRQGTAILSLTRGGSELGRKLANPLDGRLYIPRRLERRGMEAEVQYFEDWEAAFSEAFHGYSRLVCIMAAGIVVRSLAALMESKYTDPAVVVVDEKGQYAISLLSGHLGGANQLAAEVAELLGGQAVITTATDVQGRRAADLLARELDAVMEPAKNLRIINRALAEEQPVYLYSPWPLVAQVQAGFSPQDWPADNRFLTPAIIISHQARISVETGPCLLLKPRNLAVGIGCRRGVAYGDIQAAVDTAMGQFNLDRRCLSRIASIDLKGDEPALGQLAAELQIPLVTYSAAEIAILADTYQESAWVKENVGVGGVCEPAARLATHGGITLVPKQKIGPVTISIAMEKSWWWDWDPAAGSI